MPLLFIIALIIVAIVFFYIGKKISIKKTLAEQEEQHKAFVKKLAQQKLKSNMRTYNEFGPKKQTKSPYLMKNDPDIRAARSYANTSAKPPKQTAVHKKQEPPQKSHIPWALIGAVGPEILKKLKKDENAQRVLEEWRKKNYR